MATADHQSEPEELLECGGDTPNDWPTRGIPGGDGEKAVLGFDHHSTVVILVGRYRWLSSVYFCTVDVVVGRDRLPTNYTAQFRRCMPHGDGDRIERLRR
jgi:hypothetical protein